MRKGLLSLNRVLEVRRDMEKYYLKMIAAAPGSKTAFRGLINIYATNRGFDAALKWYGKMIEKYPDEYDAGYDLGWRLTEGRQYARAVEVFRRLITIRNDYETNYNLGYALAWSGDKYGAELCLLEATRLDPADWRAFYSLGYVYTDTGRYKQAREAWGKTLELMPNFPEVRENLNSIRDK